MCATCNTNLQEDRNDKISNAIFLIGLGALFLGGFPFWPGILFVVGFSSLARGLSEGKTWYAMQGALWTIGIGAMFYFHFSWPIFLIIIGISMLLGRTYRPPMFRSDTESNGSHTRKAKRKNKTDDGFEYYDEEDYV